MSSINPKFNFEIKRQLYVFVDEKVEGRVRG